MRTTDISISAVSEAWPIDGAFTISRGSKRQAIVVVATVACGVHAGRGEAVPYARYGETLDGTLAAVRSVANVHTREDLARLLPAGAARNALDCAFWDLEAKRGATTVTALAGIEMPASPLLTCYTLSLASADEMAAKARAAADKPLLKLKLGGGLEDAGRMRAVRAARPDARIVADANEAWTEADLDRLLLAARDAGLELIEQPLPAARDEALAKCRHHVPICADESAHTSDDLSRLRPLYDAVNIKLDKAGGLTEALAMARAARELGFSIMAGCMVSTSLAMAPACLLAPFAMWLDLDGPLLLARDREPSIVYEDGRIRWPLPGGSWGMP